MKPSKDMTNPVKPKALSNRNSSRLWFTVSNAADKSRSKRETFSPLSSDSMMSLVTDCRAVSVLWNVKPRPNDRNIVGRNMLRACGHHVATCQVLMPKIWPVSNLSQQHPTCCNTSQHGGQTHATCCPQQCCDMLGWHVGIVWPGLKGYVCCSILYKMFSCHFFLHSRLPTGIAQWISWLELTLQKHVS